jgi:alginate O-acetyltransferase complex protein AlgJ
MNRFALSHPITRAAFCVFLILLPLASAWNLVVTQNHPEAAIKIGPKLDGVTTDVPVVLSWPALLDGSLQKAIANRVTNAMVVRPILIRVNNEIRYELFGDLTASYVVRGTNGQLIGRSYLEEYCGRTEGMAAKFAADIVPKLKDIQNYYRAHGGVFVYVVSPSKAAHMPEYFLNSYPCPSTTEARAQLVPQYVGILKQAGINVVDTASLIHSLKGSYEVGLFPEGGVHWNDIGGTRAVSAIIEEINRQAGYEIIPPFKFTYTLSRPMSGADRELVDLLNVFFPPLGYQTPIVKFLPSVACAENPARNLKIAMVTSSFGHLPARLMIEGNCLSELNLYYYAKTGRFGGTPYRELKRGLSDADFQSVRDAKVVIVEENESFLAQTNYVHELQMLVNKP